MTNTFGDNGLLSRRAGSASAFDPSGNVAQRLSSSQSVLSSDLYGAFGAKHSTGGPDVFGYGGQFGHYTYAETGLGHADS